MLGLREAGVIGVSVALAGGLAYVIWNYASFSGEKKTDETHRAEDGEGVEEKRLEEKRGDAEQTVVDPPVEPVVAAVRVQKASEPRPVKSEGTQVLVLGLDGAGKSSLLHCLAIGSLDVDVEPTCGFNAVSINREDLHVEFLEIGGNVALRPYWQRYMSKALLLVFVVDSSATQLFTVVKPLLHGLLSSDPSLPLMVLANKQDLPGACSITDLHDALELSHVGDRKMFLIGTCVKKGEAELSSGVQDARDLIIQMAGGK
ncbi:ADP-ribosylation factor-like protein 9 isoform X2 [Dunckerocampus dactyliophorus]|uniref:ADP-ribosylation factor-like protein 9 isoform X2 n=1 Tax=Dunckerocampus dactyliophorus TaxID=161453 RepID=UPI0024050B86|nr:ADP-ribosylation factor-like protein 9 isoform X2 [Dunckerocampus dactyliophorus]